MAITEEMTAKRGQRRKVAQASTGAPATGTNPNAPEDEQPFKELEWPLVRRILAWMAPYRAQYIIALLLNIEFTILDMLGPMFMRWLIDHDITGHRHFLVTALAWFSPSAADNLSAWFGDRVKFWNIGLTIGTWALAVVVSNLTNRFNIKFNRRIGEQVIFSIRKALFAHLQHLSMSFYDRTKFGRILSRATSDIDALSNPIINGINTVVVNGLMMGTAAVMLFIADWRIALATLWLGPVLYLMNNYYRRRIGAQYRVAREAYTRVSTNLAENINGMRVVTAFNRQEDNLASFNVLQDNNTTNNVKAGVMNGVYQPLLQIVGFIGTAIILISGAYLALSHAGGFTVGTLVALTMFWGMFMNPVLNFGNFQNEMMQSMASAERVFAMLDLTPDVTDTPDAVDLPRIDGRVTFEHVHFEYVAGKPVLNFGNFQNEMMQSMASAERVFAMLDLTPDVTDTPDAVDLPRIDGRVTFEHVHFEYAKAKPVLHDISFDALAGQTVALVGHTGCGKSTIMNLLCRFYLPQQGRVLIDGHDLTTIKGDSLHRQMGIVSQANFLFSGTVMDNIRYANAGATEDEVIAAATTLGSHDVLLALKDGYQTQVGERGASMSLGQRQLICFTRAFLANPRVLMLDEATSAVDTHTEMIIQQALDKLVAHRTTFIVAHRLSTVTRADLVLVLDHGRIIERGTHATLLALGGKYAELYKQFTRDIG